jgi:cellobiose-specific phosphotransferase system component IIC
VENGSIAIGNLGSTAMFPAIICSLVSGAILKLCGIRKYILKCRRRSPAIEATFAFLIPGIFVFALMWVKNPS